MLRRLAEATLTSKKPEKNRMIYEAASHPWWIGDSRDRRSGFVMGS